VQIKYSLSDPIAVQTGSQSKALAIFGLDIEEQIFQAISFGIQTSRFFSKLPLMVRAAVAFEMVFTVTLINFISTLEMGGGETTNVAAVAAGVSVAIIVVAGAAGFGIWYRRKSQMKSANKLAQSKLQSHYSTEPAKVAVQERTTWERSTITDRVSTLQADL
jgi:hypothetical protein